MSGSGILDLRGLKCPEPLKRAEEALEAMGDAALTVFVESPSERNIERYAKKRGMGVETLKRSDHFELRITKPLSGLKPEAPDAGKGILLIVGTDAMGKEEGIGRILMKAFFETMMVTRELPHTIFFLNAGVRLTTVDSGVLPSLKDIEAMGVEIYSCGTCLEHFGLEGSLKVGHRGSTNIVVEGIQDFQKVLWI